MHFHFHWLTYLIVYIICGSGFYVLSPIYYKIFGWKTDGIDYPPPELLAVFWPITFIITIGFAVVVAILLGLAPPCYGLKLVYEKVERYISAEGAEARAIKKRLAKEAKKKRIAFVDVAELKRPNKEEFDAALSSYRQANCNGCGQSLIRT